MCLSTSKKKKKKRSRVFFFFATAAAADDLKFKKRIISLHPVSSPFSLPLAHEGCGLLLLSCKAKRGREDLFFCFLFFFFSEEEEEKKEKNVVSQNSAAVKENRFSLAADSTAPLM